jgi:hypothetical protein
MPFIKNEKWEGKTGPFWGLLSSGGRYKERIEEADYSGNIIY